jgi:uracil phosphoribosyltransferase
MMEGPCRDSIERRAMTAAFPNLHLLDHPLIRHKLSIVRDAATPSGQFRRLLGEIAALMAYEACRHLPLEAIAVRTPIAEAACHRIAAPVTLVPILRAGIGMTEGLLSLMPEARVGHLGIYRDEKTIEPVCYYSKVPEDIAAGPVFIIDPMLATGGSAAFAASELKRLGCRELRMICLVAAPPGVERMLRAHPDLPIHAAALDDRLDERKYIVPGLGDAGDRIFGTQ